MPFAFAYFCSGIKYQKGISLKQKKAKKGQAGEMRWRKVVAKKQKKCKNEPKSVWNRKCMTENQTTWKRKQIFYILCCSSIFNNSYFSFLFILQPRSTLIRHRKVFSQEFGIFLELKKRNFCVFVVHFFISNNIIVVIGELRWGKSQ